MALQPVNILWSLLSHPPAYAVPPDFFVALLLSLQDRELHCCSHPTRALSLSVPVPVSRICSRESKIAAATIAHEKEKRKPKYIGNLLKQAKMRAVESDRIFDRKLQKEREEQDKVRRQAGRQAGGEGVFCLLHACTHCCGSSARHRYEVVEGFAVSLSREFLGSRRVRFLPLCSAPARCQPTSTECEPVGT